MFPLSWFTVSFLSEILYFCYRDGLLESAVVSKTFNVNDFVDTDTSSFFDTTDLTTDTDTTTTATNKSKSKRKKVRIC